MPAPPTTHRYSLPSIQTVYTLYWEIKNDIPVLQCKDVIEVPIDEPVIRVVGNDVFTVQPYTAFVFKPNTSNDILVADPVFFIETNEGVTVEPIIASSPRVFDSEIYLLALPRGTTGVKNVRIRESGNYDYTVPNDLTFDIMKTPYNYENYIPTFLSADLTNFECYVGQRLHDLTDRVTALENKNA